MLETCPSNTLQAAGLRILALLLLLLLLLLVPLEQRNFNHTTRTTLCRSSNLDNKNRYLW